MAMFDHVKVQLISLHKKGNQRKFKGKKVSLDTITVIYKYT